VNDARTAERVQHTGRPLDSTGEPKERPALPLNLDGPAARRLRESSGPLVASPNTGVWATLISAADGPDGRPVMVQWLAPDGAEPPPHVHPTTETFEVLAGELTVVAGGETRRLTAGESLTVESGVEHTFRNDSDDFVAFEAAVPSIATVEALFSTWGSDAEGAFGADGQPGPLFGLLAAEHLRDDTTMTMAPMAVQRALWATVGRAARALGYRAVEERYLTEEFWRARIEQPDLTSGQDESRDSGASRPG
jgi:quercetin dioxygenase-like cupin family protein